MIKILLMSTITMSVYSSIALCVTGEYQMAANDTSDVRQTKDVQLCRLICAGARPFKVDGECLCRAPDFSKGEKYPKYYRLNEEKFIGFDSLYNRIYAPSVGTSVTTNRKSAESRLQYNNLENERRVSELLVKNCVNGCDGGYVNMSCECIPFDVMYDPIMPESDKHKRQIDLLYRTKKSHKEQVLDAE